MGNPQTLNNNLNELILNHQESKCTQLGQYDGVVAHACTPTYMVHGHQ
jgi:hypothetical protein